MAGLAMPVDLFLLPGGRPRFLAIDSQAGGLPRRLPRPRANRSKLIIASSICSRSWRSSARILVTSMFCSQGPVPGIPEHRSEFRTTDPLRLHRYLSISASLAGFQVFCSEFRTENAPAGTGGLPESTPVHSPQDFPRITAKIAAANENKRVIQPK